MTHISYELKKKTFPSEPDFHMKIEHKISKKKTIKVNWGQKNGIWISEKDGKDSKVDSVWSGCDDTRAKMQNKNVRSNESKANVDKHL